VEAKHSPMARSRSRSRDRSKRKRSRSRSRDRRKVSSSSSSSRSRSRSRDRRRSRSRSLSSSRSRSEQRGSRKAKRTKVLGNGGSAKKSSKEKEKDKGDKKSDKKSSKEKEKEKDKGDKKNEKKGDKKKNDKTDKSEKGDKKKSDKKSDKKKKSSKSKAKDKRSTKKSKKKSDSESDSEDEADSPDPALVTLQADVDAACSKRDEARDETAALREHLEQQQSAHAAHSDDMKLHETTVREAQEKLSTAEEVHKVYRAKVAQMASSVAQAKASHKEQRGRHEQLLQKIAVVESDKQDLQSEIATIRGAAVPKPADDAGERVPLWRQALLDEEVEDDDAAKIATTEDDSDNMDMDDAIAAEMEPLPAIAPVVKRRAFTEDSEEEEVDPDVAGSSSALVLALAHSDHGTQHRDAVLGHMSVPMLWRLRAVSRAFRRWGTEALAEMPGLLAIGGYRWNSKDEPEPITTVEALELITMRWSRGAFPALSTPTAYPAGSSLPDGRLVVAGGFESLGPPEIRSRAVVQLNVNKGEERWTPLPSLGEERVGAAAVLLADGRLMLIGGGSQKVWLDSAEVLATDGEDWDAVSAMAVARGFAAAGLLPTGHVVVAGGRCSGGDKGVLDTAEMWSPAEDAWTALPAMHHARTAAAHCVLPSGRFAVVGGFGSDGEERGDGEVFDPARRTWKMLPSGMEERSEAQAIAVAGGMVVMGGTYGVAELFDEQSGTWFRLPRSMAGQRLGCVVAEFKDTRFD
jgi:hypothetical protein